MGIEHHRLKNLEQNEDESEVQQNEDQSEKIALLKRKISNLQKQINNEQIENVEIGNYGRFMTMEGGITLFIIGMINSFVIMGVLRFLAKSKKCCDRSTDKRL